VDGTDANAIQFSNINAIACAEHGIIDNSFLGNLWNNTHTSGRHGILHTISPASMSQFNYAYTEVGTVNSFGTSAMGMGYQSAHEDGGLRFVPGNGSLGVPPLQVYHISYPYGQWYMGLRRPEVTGAGIFSGNLSALGGATSFQIFDTNKTGYVGIVDHSANKALLHFSMANGVAGGATLVNDLRLGNGDDTASAVTAGNYRRVKSGSAAPVAGAWEAGDIVFNSAPTAGGKIGWVCVTGGSPGTWKTWGAIDA
jgi:hypothetical protein